jgi:hypothetical protein
VSWRQYARPSSSPPASFSTAPPLTTDARATPPAGSQGDRDGTWCRSAHRTRGSDRHPNSGPRCRSGPPLVSGGIEWCEAADRLRRSGTSHAGFYPLMRRSAR